jgi:hypothetical protein
MPKLLKNPLILFFLTVALIGLLALFGPEEKSLGSNVRIVYLHGAWVLTAEIAFIAAGFIGLLGFLGSLGLPALIPSAPRLNLWSTAFGRTGIIFWVTYLPLSLLAMQTNWNGLFLAEPRFKLALTFAIVGVLLQIGLWFINILWVNSLANAIFIFALRVTFARAAYVMHPPPSPIYNSGNFAIIFYFTSLVLLSLLAGWFLTRWFYLRAVARTSA